MEKIKLKRLIRQVRGVSYKPHDLHDELNDDSVILLRANNIDNGRINFEDVVYVDRSKVSIEQYLKRGDILICASSGSKNLVGKAASIDFDGNYTFGAFCKVVRPNEDIVDYLGTYFQSPIYRRKISELAIGANINNIRNEHIDELDVPIYASEEQYDIVKKLEKVRNILNWRREELVKLDELIQSRFVELFGNILCDSALPLVQLKELADIGSSKRIYANEYVESGVPFYRSKEIRELGTGQKPSVELFIKQERYDEIKTKYGVPKIGDILIAAIGATIGYSWIVDTDKPFYYKDGNLIILSTKNNVNPIFLNHTMGILIEDFKSKGVAGSAQLALTIEKVEKMMVINPSIDLQNQFATFVTQTDKSKSAVQKSLDEAQLLFDSLMQKYFG